MGISIIETCPHCGAENHYPNWDIKSQGYVAKCHNCEAEIMLCSVCPHLSAGCDWGESDDGVGECIMGCTINNRSKIKKHLHPKYEVWLLGYTENGFITDFEQQIGRTVATKKHAVAIAEHYLANHSFVQVDDEVDYVEVVVEKVIERENMVEAIDSDTVEIIPNKKEN